MRDRLPALEQQKQTVIAVLVSGSDLDARPILAGLVRALIVALVAETDNDVGTAGDRVQTRDTDEQACVSYHWPCVYSAAVPDQAPPGDETSLLTIREVAKLLRVHTRIMSMSGSCELERYLPQLQLRRWLYPKFVFVLDQE